MDRLKTFAKYAVWIILFWILSDILIYFGLNSTYKQIEEQNELSSQIIVNRAEATRVNGRINGKIINNEEQDLSGKYLKIDLYSSIGNILGTNYLEIGKLEPNETREFETYFKVQDVKSYSISVVDQKEEIVGEFMTEDMTKLAVIALLAYMIFF